MSFTPSHIAIIGSNGAIGQAFLNYFAVNLPKATIHAVCREIPNHPIAQVHYHQTDYLDEIKLKEIADSIKHHGPLNLVIVATGMLHSETIQPEKSLNDITQENLTKLFEINTIIPTLMAKYFLPLLSKEGKSVFAALSARVGSISDNRKGGWYAYRASKAALNMIIKSAAIEASRTHKYSIVVGLHPGTVSSKLSDPFVKNVASEDLFSPTHAAIRLIEVISQLEQSNTGKCFAWDGQEILP